MYIFRYNDTIPWDNCVATVGFFDGVHAGHRYLLQSVRDIARDEHKISVVITFDNHPRKILHADFQPKLLTTLDEKISVLSETGVDACVVLNFTKDLSQLSAFSFLKDVLHNTLKVSTLLVGHDHRFGHNREQGFDEYRAFGATLGMNVIQVEKYTTDEAHHISSSEVRHALERGEIAQANKLLTYPFILTGRVKSGFQVGRKIGFPTANLTPSDKDKIIPATGVYAVRVKWDNHTFRGMMNIGYRPTMGHSDEKSLEVHILDFEGDVYDRNLKIEFIAKIRDEMKFSSVDELIIQLEKDKDTVIAMDY
ncbi:MAG TPA: bifunctional riboflavin kinase/FAD synthetase [Paludibacteraceae bacterium]|nr:bifunctional riboflavin kinase/FAD synthetase [Paludibacteraceae bacterium]HPT42344.1 bifunctional riboflavin kinase/FAD synthetase [Paludibacteraceae bacterium]